MRHTDRCGSVRFSTVVRSPQSHWLVVRPIVARSVLVVDDCQCARRAIAMLAAHFGAAVQTASDGIEACERVAESMMAGCPFDLVLMDVRMPDMDGLQATRQIRGHGFEGRVIAMTGDTFRDSRAAALAVGCNDWVQKPIDAAWLENVMFNVDKPLRIAVAG